MLEANLIHVMDFVSVELYTVTYLGLHLVRKCETLQTWKQTVKQLLQRLRFTHPLIMNSSQQGHSFLIM